MFYNRNHTIHNKVSSLSLCVFLGDYNFFLFLLLFIRIRIRKSTQLFIHSFHNLFAPRPSVPGDKTSSLINEKSLTTLFLVNKPSWQKGRERRERGKILRYWPKGRKSSLFFPILPLREYAPPLSMWMASKRRQDGRWMANNHHQSHATSCASLGCIYIIFRSNFLA